jgi:hypothetical protein
MSKYQEQFDELMKAVREVSLAVHEEAPTQDQILSVAVAVATTPNVRVAWEAMLTFVRERARIQSPPAPPLEADVSEMVREVGLLLAAGASIPGAPGATDSLRDLHAKLAPRARKAG